MFSESYWSPSRLEKNDIVDFYARILHLAASCEAFDALVDVLIMDSRVFMAVLSYKNSLLFGSLVAMINTML